MEMFLTMAIVGRVEAKKNGEQKSQIVPFGIKLIILFTNLENLE
jgi:hypothetical protein